MNSNEEELQLEKTLKERLLFLIEERNGIRISLDEFVNNEQYIDFIMSSVITDKVIKALRNNDLNNVDIKVCCFVIATSGLLFNDEKSQDRIVRRMSELLQKLSSSREECFVSAMILSKLASLTVDKITGGLL